MFDILGKLNEAKKKAEEVKLRLEKIEFSSTSGSVKVTVNGNRKVLSIELLDDTLTSTTKIQLQDNIKIAVNEAMDNAGSSAEAEMAAITRGMLPGM